MTDKPCNVVELRPGTRLPDTITPDAALIYIRALVENVSHASGQKHVDLTLQAIREIIAKVLP